MLEDLSAKLESVIKKVRGQGKLTEKNIAESLKEIRRALLEADVNYRVVKQFIADVQEKALGEEVLRSVTPGQQIVKIVHDELANLMGETYTDLKTAGIPPTIILLAGLQGSGKTTFAGKLANYLRKKGRRPMLVGADVYRPAAKKQLQVLGDSLGVPVYTTESDNAVKICKESVRAAREQSCDVLILDTAGRLHIDEALMAELTRIKRELKPHEILFVADGMTGQDAVNTAKEFLEQLDFDGVVLTKMDGDARGGAALSIRAVTERPIKFIGTGEKLDAIEPFYPDRIASRILGMGDVITFVEKAQETVDVEAAQKLEKKIRRADFNLEDFYDQLQQIKKMGPIDQLLGMIPGMGNRIRGMQVDDTAFGRIEAIINSMTVQERKKPGIINGSRRKRIAKGCGMKVQDVNQLLRQFQEMKKMMKRMKKMNFKGGLRPGALPF